MCAWPRVRGCEYQDACCWDGKQDMLRVCDAGDMFLAVDAHRLAQRNVVDPSSAGPSSAAVVVPPHGRHGQGGAQF
jgi:hypothetical protein